MEQVEGFDKIVTWWLIDYKRPCCLYLIRWLALLSEDDEEDITDFKEEVKDEDIKPTM